MDWYNPIIMSSNSPELGQWREIWCRTSFKTQCPTNIVGQPGRKWVQQVRALSKCNTIHTQATKKVHITTPKPDQALLRQRMWNKYRLLVRLIQLTHVIDKPWLITKPLSPRIFCTPKTMIQTEFGNRNSILQAKRTPLNNWTTLINPKPVVIMLKIQEVEILNTFLLTIKVIEISINLGEIITQDILWLQPTWLGTVHRTTLAR